jgi:hypothetical protein
MIPDKKKTPEEIAAFREDLGIPRTAAEQTQSPAPEHASPPDEPVIHLDIQEDIPKLTRALQTHCFRKQDLPLAPAPPVTTKTALPTQRHTTDDIAQLRKREALAKLDTPGLDPAAHLRAQTAIPFLYVPGYLLAIVAAAAAYQRVHHTTPLVLIALSLLITLYIAIRKPRSRHHAALIFIIIFLTAVFCGIHYAPLFHYGS